MAPKYFDPVKNDWVDDKDKDGKNKKKKTTNQASSYSSGKSNKTGSKRVRSESTTSSSSQHRKGQGPTSPPPATSAPPSRSGTPISIRSSTPVPGLSRASSSQAGVFAPPSRQSTSGSTRAVTAKAKLPGQGTGGSTRITSSQATAAVVIGKQWKAKLERRKVAKTAAPAAPAAFAPKSSSTAAATRRDPLDKIRSITAHSSFKKAPEQALARTDTPPPPSAPRKESRLPSPAPPSRPSSRTAPSTPPIQPPKKIHPQRANKTGQRRKCWQGYWEKEGKGEFKGKKVWYCCECLRLLRQKEPDPLFNEIKEDDL